LNSTVVFVDLRGFTGFTETAEPEEVMSDELQALRMALVMRDSVTALARGWKKRGFA
jgi:hypothetical protein